MRRTIPAVALAVALVMGGAATWHFTRPDKAEKLGTQAEDVLNTLPSPSSSIPVPAPSKTKTTAAYPKESKPKLHSSGWAVIRIPSIKLTFPIVEGTDEERDLERGVGHYTYTALPGQVGNFSLAGHVCCEDNGQPFKNLHKLRVGGSIFIDTKAARYTYQVIDSTACGQTQMTVHMSKIQVIDPVPCTKLKPTSALMTLTTCTTFERPRPATYRRIVWAELVKVEARS